MTKLDDIKNRYVKEIREELKAMKDSVRKEENSSPRDLIYRSGIISGLEKAINLIKEYE